MPAGSKSLNERVPAAQVKLLSSKRGVRAGRATAGSAAGVSTTSSHDRSRSASRSSVARAGVGLRSRAGVGPLPVLAAAGAARARWIAVVASASRPPCTRRPAARIFFRNLLISGVRSALCCSATNEGYPGPRSLACSDYFGLGRGRSARSAASSPARRACVTRATARRDVAGLLLHRVVLVERVVAGRVRLVVADEAVEAGLVAGIDQAHPVEPVGERAARALDAGDVAVHDQAVDAACRGASDSPSPSARAPWPSPGPCRAVEVGSGLPPSAQTSRSIISLSALEVLYQCVGVTMTIAWARDPALVDLVHPVVDLVERVVRIAAARPVAERHRGRHAALAGVDLAAVFRREQAQVEEVDLDPVLREHLADEAGEAERLRDLARAGAVVARRAADHERARRRLRVGPGRLRAARCAPWRRSSRPTGRSRDRRSPGRPFA